MDKVGRPLDPTALVMDGSAVVGRQSPVTLPSSKAPGMSDIDGPSAAVQVPGQSPAQVCKSCERRVTLDTCACCGEPLCVPCSREQLEDCEVAQLAWERMLDRNREAEALARGWML